MDHSKAIASAEMMAALRAAAAFETALLEPCRDLFARNFVGSALARIADFKPHFLLKHVMRMRAPGSYPFAIARTRYFDQMLRHELDNGAVQVVVLGAGYDSRACRFAQELEGATVFELDHPATQARKRQLIADAKLTWPSNAHFVPVDFTCERFADKLADAGFDRNKRTVFLWEGVSYYLPESAVAAVMDFVSACAPGSAIVFDYALRSFVAGDHSTFGGKQVVRWLQEIKEPFLFGLQGHETRGFLAAHGLDLDSDLGPRELEALYLVTRRGGSLGSPLGHVRMCVGRVPAQNS